MPKLTIQDVARAAEVSPTSVSNYLNGRHDMMRDDTRQRIADTIGRLGYKPNSAARQLKTGHSPMLGLLVPTTANPFFGELAAEIELAAQHYGFRILLCNTLREKEKEREFAAELVSYGIRGLILGSAIRDRDGILTLIRRDVAVVAFDVLLKDIAIDGIDVVTIDNVQATLSAVRYLAGQGHRRIAYVSAPLGTIGREARMRGYEEGIREFGLKSHAVITSAPKSRPTHGDTDLVWLGRHAVSQLAKGNEMPTAIVAMNDLVASGLASGLRERGLSVPHDVSLVGIDDINLASIMTPPLTTVPQPFPEMAQAAVSALCERMKDSKLPSRETVFTPDLIIRASTGPAPLSKPEGASVPKKSTKQPLQQQ